MLTGTGIVDPMTSTIMSGGTLAPGSGTPDHRSRLTAISPSSRRALPRAGQSIGASFATVTGAATLAGATLGVVFASGSYVGRQYTILTAAGGVSGTFAPSLVSTNLPAGFQTSLSYDANDVFLNLRANLGNGASLNRNQQNVTGSVNDFFNNGGALPPAFLSLFGSSGGALANGLTQASGELGTGAQQTTFGAMSQFTGLLTDPFMARDGGAGAAPGAAGFAEEGEGASASTANKRDAFAMFTKVPVPAFVQRWSVWASGFGGAQSTDGNAVGRRQRHHEPHLRHGGGGGLSVLAEHARRLCARGRRHEFLASAISAAVAPICSRPAPICGTPAVPPTFPRRWPMAGRTSPPIAP